MTALWGWGWEVTETLRKRVSLEEAGHWAGVLESSSCPGLSTLSAP